MASLEASFNYYKPGHKTLMDDGHITIDWIFNVDMNDELLAIYFRDNSEYYNYENIKAGKARFNYVYKEKLSKFEINCIKETIMRFIQLVEVKHGVSDEVRSKRCGRDKLSSLS
jgi:hypothetical protein